MCSIKNIIFDLGGVLLDIDYNKTFKAFEVIGYNHFDRRFSQFTAAPLFEQLETGKIDEISFIDEMINAGTKPVSPEQIIVAWNAMILNFRAESLKFLNSIANKYKLYLLSNTNIIHFKYFQQKFIEQTGQGLLDVYFNKAWYSHQIGLRKPYKEIYEYILQDEALISAETLFIDDTIDNIKMASQLGLKTHHLLPTEKIEQLSL